MPPATLDDYLASLSDSEVAASAPVELVIDRRTGRARQAGTVDPDGLYPELLRERAERSLFVFAKGILGYDFLTRRLHKPICDWLVAVWPPHKRRKGLLIPRFHGKSTIVSQCLPIHMHIQPDSASPVSADDRRAAFERRTAPGEAGLYFADRSGADTRVLIVCKSEPRASKHLRVVQTHYETNAMLRALWPHRCWDVPRRQAKKWNDTELLIPRTHEYADVSLQAIGIGGAITGGHFDARIYDDIIDIEDANSVTVMESAIDWHTASRALSHDPATSLEFDIGTRWAVHDLYEHIERHDPSVEWLKMAIVEGGLPIWPEKMSLEMVGQLQREFGPLFALQFMNAAADPSLVDFLEADLRAYRFEGDLIEFDEDDRDAALVERATGPREEAQRGDAMRGQRLTADTLVEAMGRHEFLRLKGS